MTSAILYVRVEYEAGPEGVVHYAAETDTVK